MPPEVFTMGKKLSDATANIRGSFPAQRQGDCGVFSFYYAAHIIQQLHGATGLTVLSVDPPRKRYHGMSSTELATLKDKTDRIAFWNPALTPKDRLTRDSSIRKFAKLEFNTGQGEIFSEAKMKSIIDHYGYGSRCNTSPKNDEKKAFIADALREDHPVLIPYHVDDYGSPCRGDGAPGSHWSVIFDTDSVDYRYVNPWYPTKAMSAAIGLFLDSNAIVDDLQYDPVYVKGAKVAKPNESLRDRGSKSKTAPYQPADQVPKNADPRQYRQMYPDGKPQQLKHVLIEVFASAEQLKSMST
jgi:hypothetical protein